MPHSINAAAAPPIAAPWLSILIPVYNVEAFLRECVTSIMEQSSSAGAEIILLDDCSTDGSLALCQELARAYTGQLRVMQHDHNQGMSAARNHMLAAAKGDYVWFLDSDDFLSGDALMQLKTIIDREAPDLVLCDYRKIKSNSKLANWLSVKKSFPGRGGKIQTDQEKLVEGVFLHRKMYAWLKIARRSLWSGLEFPTGKYFEDIAAVPYLLLRSQAYFYTTQNWVNYRIRPHSVMTSMRQARHIFDARKNGDAAAALSGYADALNVHFGKIPAAVAYAIAHFIAKEYTKLARRYHIAERSARIQDDRSAVLPLSHYRQLMEASSPLSFVNLRREYLMRLKLWDYFALSRSMARAVRAG
jgi:glycosyltransferase involved in cell wall biosynthesis